jgi:hypothetical protein
MRIAFCGMLLNVFNWSLTTCPGPTSSVITSPSMPSPVASLGLVLDQPA